MKDIISLICYIEGKEKEITIYKKDLENVMKQFWEIFKEEIYDLEDNYYFQNIIRDVVVEALNRE